MKRTAQATASTRDELRPEYQFDYTKARPNPYAKRLRDGGMVVVLDDEIARVFKTPESVKSVLRALIATMPPTSTTKPSPRHAKSGRSAA